MNIKSVSHVKSVIYPSCINIKLLKLKKNKYDYNTSGIINNK